jgi:hypothetical protein
MKPFLHRWAFIGLSTAVFVFFSEKAYWYPQGYAFWGLLPFYGMPAFASLWSIAYFRVHRLPALVLVAALFSFLVEGVLTPVLYEDGLFSPIMPAYFIGWHGLLSVIFGWYLLRRWLVAGRWLYLLAGSVGFGLLWGVWALTYWLPQQGAEFAAGGAWPTTDFALHALTFTLMLMVAHWLLGQGAWLSCFSPSRVEIGIVVAILAFFFVTLALPSAPLGIFKLLVLLTAVFLPLSLNRRREAPGSILPTLIGPAPWRGLALLQTMPLTATAVYALASVRQPTTETLLAILEITPLLQAAVGALVFLWALLATIRPRPTHGGY